jgi:hypothetical protein
MSRTFACLTLLFVVRTASADDAACIAAAEQSLTLRKQAKLHDALKQLAACADPACPNEVKEECTKRIADIDALMPTLIFAAKDLVGNDLDMVVVTMDGQPFTDRLDGRPVSLDPVDHKFHFEFTGAPPLDKTIVIREGERDRHENIVMQITPPLPVKFWSAPRVLGLSSGVLGVASIAVGSVFGAFAILVQNQEQSDCSAALCLHPKQAQTDYNYAQMNATASTVLFISGGVLAAAGVVLWLIAPKRKLSLSPTAFQSGVMLSGAF